MTNYRIKERAVNLGMSLRELSGYVADKLPQYRVTLPALSAAINCRGAMTERDRRMCEAADSILRERENN